MLVRILVLSSRLRTEKFTCKLLRLNFSPSIAHSTSDSMHIHLRAMTHTCSTLHVYSYSQPWAPTRTRLCGHWSDTVLTNKICRRAGWIASCWIWKKTFQQAQNVRLTFLMPSHRIVPYEARLLRMDHMAIVPLNARTYNDSVTPCIWMISTRCPPTRHQCSRFQVISCSIPFQRRVMSDAQHASNAERNF